MSKFYFDVEQGSEAWDQLRLGLPTASNFHKIITSTGKLSAQSEEYADLLIANKLFGYETKPLQGLPYIERGKELEPDAIRFYEFDQEIETQRVGFVSTDDGEIGCSPDLLVGEKGLAQLKCPAPHTHIGYLRRGIGQDYRVQMQGEMWLTGREWNHFYSYHPQAQPVLIKVERNDQFIEILAAAVGEFVKKKNEALEKIRRDGFFELREELRSVLDKHNYESVLAG